MTINNVKCSEIVNQVKNYILTNCSNLDSKFDSIPLCFLKGYRQDIYQDHAWTMYAGKWYRGSQYVPILRYAIREDIPDNYIVKQTSTAFQNSFNNYLTLTGIQNILNENLIPDSCIKVYNYLFYYLNVEFGIYASEFSSIKPFVFLNKAISKSSIDSINNLVSVNSIENTAQLIDNSLLYLKSYICQYSFYYVSQRNW